MRVLAAVALVALAMHAGVHADSLLGNLAKKTSWWDKITEAESTDGNLGKLAIVKQQLKLLADLPRDEQLVTLQKVGMKVAASTGSCNIFGGEAACLELPADSAFAQLCPHQPLRVDCAYYNDALAEVEEDPLADVRANMAERGDAVCESCLFHEQQLWCGQAVPPCGSFQSHVETALLPTLRDLAEAEEEANDGVTLPGQAAAAQAQALAKAVPQLLHAMSLTMPCREMCTAVVRSCGCGQSRTFGQLITMVSASGNGQLPQLPPQVSEALFAGVWTVQLCDLYTPSTDSAFAGHCALPETALQTATCEWCGDEPAALFTEMQMASMLASEVYSWMAGPLGLSAEADELEREGDDGELGEEAEEAEAALGSARARTPQGGTGTGWAVAVTVTVCLAVLGAASAGGCWYYQHRMSTSLQSYFSMGADPETALYTPMEYEAPVGVPLSNVLDEL